MLQERDRSTLLKSINPASKLWLALGLLLSNIIIKNLWFSLAIIIISVILVIKEKQFTLFKVLVVTMLILGGSMYALHGAIAPVIDKANDPVLCIWYSLLCSRICLCDSFCNAYHTDDVLIVPFVYDYGRGRSWRCNV